MEEQGAHWAKALFLVGFIVVLLITPWIMAREPSASRSTGSAASGAGSRPFFSSVRERRLWLCVVVVLGVIYSSLGLARQLADELRAAGLLGLSSVAVVALAGAVIAVRWARTRPGRLEIGAGLGIAAVVSMAMARTTVTERTHLFEYGLVAILIYQALLERRRNGRTVRLPAVLAILATALLGWLDEGIQSLLPSRVYDVDDVMVNAVAGMVMIASSLILAWARRLDFRRRRRR